jgi:hypothetical protein
MGRLKFYDSFVWLDSILFMLQFSSLIIHFFIQLFFNAKIKKIPNVSIMLELMSYSHYQWNQINLSLLLLYMYIRTNHSKVSSIDSLHF